MLESWIETKLENLKNHERILVRDPLHILPEASALLNSFAKANNFTVIVASTNLVFRELYEKACVDPDVRKILLLDRAPARRRQSPSITKAPPPFYPDFLSRCSEEARIELDLREFLTQKTGDSLWTAEANDPRYARLIIRNLKGVLRAHQNLKVARPTQFTDSDFKTIVAYASLGIAETAFKKLDSKSLWKVALLSHKALSELQFLAPEITQPITDNLRKAPAPFCWFAEHPPETATRAFYLALILSQHAENWNLLLTNVDPELAAFSNIDQKILTGSAPGLIQLNPRQADQDIKDAEDSLTKDALELILVKQLNLSEPKGFASVLQKENYSLLIRSLALVLAIKDLISSKPDVSQQNKIYSAIFPDTAVTASATKFVDQRESETWSHLKEAYRLAFNIQKLRGELAGFTKLLAVKKPSELTYAFFWDYWNTRKLNRLEYFLSSLERLIAKSDLLPRESNAIPASFATLPSDIRARLQEIILEVNKNLDYTNAVFQQMVFLQYPAWLKQKDSVYLASHFISRILKPRWDAKHEHAVIFIFDGMRYDIWDEFLRPMLLDRMEVTDDLIATALLPSETEISRWALSAGSEPGDFWPRKSEDKHLKDALLRTMSYQGNVEVISPEGAGTGETVRYKADNLEMYIFEFCDKELHRIGIKTLPDGREVPTRPLAFVYEQYIKNIIENEVMSIVRTFKPGTKLFITADHGFTRVHRERIWLDSSWLNESSDCAYLHAKLKKSLKSVMAPLKVRQNVLEFDIEALNMPRSEEVRDRASRATVTKTYESIVFPKTGYALSRPGSPFQPAAYTHGGISMQELMIPMIVLQTKEQEQSLITMEQIDGPLDLVEGQEAVFTIVFAKTNTSQDEIRLEIQASIRPEKPSDDIDEAKQCTFDLPTQLIYLNEMASSVSFKIKGDQIRATETERRVGSMQRTITITASYNDGQKVHRKSRGKQFAVRLNSESIIRRVGNLGNILGLSPKTLR